MIALIGLKPFDIGRLMILFGNVLQDRHLLPLDGCIDDDEERAEVLIDAILVYREPS